MSKQASSSSSSSKGWRGRFWLVAAGLCVLACGGKLDEDDGAASGENVGAPNATGSPKPGTPGTALPPCELGFVLNQDPARDCNWLARERCYETKLAACACVCPVNRQDSICSSGFDNGPNGRTEVKCY